MEAVGARYLHSPGIPEEPKDDLCSPCVQLGTQSINILLNYILNAGVVGGCSKLCSHTQLSKANQNVCKVACGYVGIKAFKQVLKHTDLDPIYFCESLHACPAGSDDASIKLVSVASHPTSIVKGNTIQLSVQLDVTKASGVGQFDILVEGPVSQPISQRFLLAKGIANGTQTLTVQLTVEDDTSGDIPMIWQPGSYRYTFEVCQGKCHSKHPHSKFFGVKSGNFSLIDQNTVTI